MNDVILPPGFSIDLYYSSEVPFARQLALSEGDNGNAIIVYVGSTDAGSVCSSKRGTRKCYVSICAKRLNDLCEKSK